MHQGEQPCAEWFRVEPIEGVLIATFTQRFFTR